MKKVVVLFFVGVTITSITLSQDIGTGLAFLKTGTTAHSLAIGETSILTRYEVGSSLYNPAVLSRANSSSVILSHKRWFEGVTTNFLGATVTDSLVNFSIVINNTSVQDIEVRRIPGPSDGVFTAQNFYGGIILSRSLSSNISLGISGKFLYEKIFVDEASGYAFDLGTIYSISDNITVGASINHLGAMTALRANPSRLPFTGRLNASFNQFITADISAYGNVEVVRTFEDKITHLHLGAEFDHSEFGSIRIGYLSGYETRNISFGVGTQYGALIFDYAYIPLKYFTTSGHIITVGFIL